MPLFSFIRQEMVYFSSVHLSIWTAGLTSWLTMHFTILLLGQNNVIPKQLFPKFQMGHVSPTGLINSVWIQSGEV
jgi:hypothetical protein